MIGALCARRAIARRARDDDDGAVRAAARLRSTAGTCRSGGTASRSRTGCSKLHGLDQKYGCEICGNARLRPARAAATSPRARAFFDALRAPRRGRRSPPPRRTDAAAAGPAPAFAAGPYAPGLPLAGIPNTKHFHGIPRRRRARALGAAGRPRRSRRGRARRRAGRRRRARARGGAGGARRARHKRCRPPRAPRPSRRPSSARCASSRRLGVLQPAARRGGAAAAARAARARALPICAVDADGGLVGPRPPSSRPRRWAPAGGDGRRRQPAQPDARRAPARAAGVRARVRAPTPTPTPTPPTADARSSRP